jgi:cystathionine gamma-synthase
MSDSRRVIITNRIVSEQGTARETALRALKMRIETIAVHAGAEIDPVTGALAPPLHLWTTFEHGPGAEAIHEFLCIREKNPTQSRLEAAFRDLEGGAAALVFSSGMAAATALVQTLAPGSHLVFSDDIYIDVRNLVRDFFPLWRIETTTADLRDVQVLRTAIRPNTKLVWIETPSNPHVRDILGAARQGSDPRRISRELKGEATAWRGTPRTQQRLRGTFGFSSR